MACGTVTLAFPLFSFVLDAYLRFKMAQRFMRLLKSFSFISNSEKTDTLFRLKKIQRIYEKFHHENSFGNELAQLNFSILENREKKNTKKSRVKAMRENQQSKSKTLLFRNLCSVFTDLFVFFLLLSITGTVYFMEYRSQTEIQELISTHETIEELGIHEAAYFSLALDFILMNGTTSFLGQPITARVQSSLNESYQSAFLQSFVSSDSTGNNVISSLEDLNSNNIYEISSENLCVLFFSGDSPCLTFAEGTLTEGLSYLVEYTGALLKNTLANFYLSQRDKNDQMEAVTQVSFIELESFYYSYTEKIYQKTTKVIVEETNAAFSSYLKESIRNLFLLIFAFSFLFLLTFLVSWATLRLDLKDIKEPFRVIQPDVFRRNKYFRNALIEASPNTRKSRGSLMFIEQS